MCPCSRLWGEATGGNRCKQPGVCEAEREREKERRGAAAILANDVAVPPPVDAERTTMAASLRASLG